MEHQEYNRRPDRSFTGDSSSHRRRCGWIRGRALAAPNSHCETTMSQFCLFVDCSDSTLTLTRAQEYEEPVTAVAASSSSLPGTWAFPTDNEAHLQISRTPPARDLAIDAQSSNKRISIGSNITWGLFSDTAGLLRCSAKLAKNGTRSRNEKFSSSPGEVIQGRRKSTVRIRSCFAKAEFPARNVSANQ